MLALNRPIDTHHDHNKYYVFQTAHEAGYDSYLTAKVMIRLSTKLEADGMHLQDIAPTDEVYFTADEGESHDPMPKGSVAFDPTLMTPIEEQPPEIALDGAVPAVQKLKDKKKKKKRKSAGVGKTEATLTPSAMSESRFSTGTVFDKLKDLNLDDSASDKLQRSPSSNGRGSSSRVGLENVPPTEGSDDEWSSSKIDYAIPEVPRQPMAQMPSAENSFWRVYGNKLRVFGTEERVCNLA